MCRHFWKGWANDGLDLVDQLCPAPAALLPSCGDRCATSLVARPGSWRRLRGAWLLATALLILSPRSPIPHGVGRARPLERHRRRRDRPDQSQQIGDRAEQTAKALAGLREQARTDFQEHRTCASSRSSPAFRASEDGTRLFDRARQHARRCSAGTHGAAIMLTDGEVHDVPASVDALGHARPRCMPSSPAAPGERDRRIIVENAPRYRHCRRGPERSSIRVVDDRRQAMHGTPVEVTIATDGGPPSSAVAARPAGPVELTISITHGGPNILEFEAVGPLTGETHHRSTTAPSSSIDGVRDTPARAAGLGRAASGRAHLAQPPQVRPVGRPRPLHHPAPAGEAGRHADQRAVADRLPDARAVRGEARPVRPDHLRPLPAPRRAAARSTLDNIAHYVRNGGALLVAAGPDYATPGSLYRTPLVAGAAGRADRQRHRASPSARI